MRHAYEKHYRLLTEAYAVKDTNRHKDPDKKTNTHKDPKKKTNTHMTHSSANTHTHKRPI